MDIDFDLEFISYAMEEEIQKLAWDMWLTLYPNFNEENFLSFDEFKNKIINKKSKKTNKTIKEIEEELMLVIAYHERGGTNENI